MYDKLKDFWQNYPIGLPETEFFKQVQRTIDGKPISSAQFESILLSIRSNLTLKRNDTLIDICCGNGIITKALANDCAIIDGIDYSEHLIKIASKYNCSPNTKYFCCSLFDILCISDLTCTVYDKVLTLQR